MSDRHGAIPRQLIAEMVEAGYVSGIPEDRATLQPSSLDLRITDECYRMRGSYLPRTNERIADIVAKSALYRHPLDRPLETGGTYLVRLAESLALPPGIHATASSKSSSGRINLRTRFLADGVARFDSIPTGYRGPLWIELIPKSFPVLLHPNDRLNQLRFFHGDARLSPFEHRMAFDTYKLLRGADGTPLPAATENVGSGITLTVDLSNHDIVGWRSQLSSWNVLDTAKFDHDPKDFFEPIGKPKSGELILQHGAFYILVTKEHVVVPPTLAAEMAPYDQTKGEFRSHFAGFFDPGFGWDEDESKRGWPAVLEVATHDHDFVLRDGQPICVMHYERLLTKPDVLYGHDLKSNYTRQTGPKLAKWFRGSIPSKSTPSTPPS